jgi:transposase
MTKNRTQAVLHRYGLIHPYSDLFGKQGLAWLRELMAPEDPRLPASGKAVVSGNLTLLLELRRQIAGVTRHLRQEIQANPNAQLWDSLPGIAWVLAYTIDAEIGTPGRFKNARHLASYSLLAPLDNDSGDEDPEVVATGRHVGRLGRKTLKRAFLQAVPSAIQKSPRLRKLYDRVTDSGKRRRAQGRIAVAHEICRIGFSCLKHQRPYQEDSPPERPGSEKKNNCRNSHSALGQPVPAMAPAMAG